MTTTRYDNEDTREQKAAAHSSEALQLLDLARQLRRAVRSAHLIDTKLAHRLRLEIVKLDERRRKVMKGPPRSNEEVLKDRNNH